MVGMCNRLSGEAEIEFMQAEIADEDCDENGDEAPQQVQILEHHRVAQTADHADTGFLCQRANNQREQQREPTVEQIARERDIPREEVVFAMDAVCDPVSLFEPIYSDGGDTMCVMEQVRDNKNTDEDWLEQIALKEAMSRLSERERQILALRYSDGKTQMEVSGEIGISQAQVSRLEKNAIKSIKKNM